MGTPLIGVMLIVKFWESCLLEPLLYIFALDCANWIIQDRGDILGVTLESGGRTIELKVSGYGEKLMYILAIVLHSHLSCPVSMISLKFRVSFVKK